MELVVFCLAIFIGAAVAYGRRDHRAASRHGDTSDIGDSDRGGWVGGSIANGAGFRGTFGIRGGGSGGSGGGGGGGGESG